MSDLYRHYAFSSFSAISPPRPLEGSCLQAVVFDLGGVLIDWNPRYLFNKCFSRSDEVEAFLAEVCSPAWNDQQDRGRLWSSAVEVLIAEHPAYSAQIAAYDTRWEETLGEAIAGTVAVLDRLRRSGNVRLLALTNWSQEKFPIARTRFEFLDWFEAIVVSGEERIAKPDPEIFERLKTRFDLRPERTLFIDDAPRNVEAAKKLGFETELFRSPDALARRLETFGLLRS